MNIVSVVGLLKQTSPILMPTSCPLCLFVFAMRQNHFELWIMNVEGFNFELCSPFKFVARGLHPVFNTKSFTAERAKM